MVFSSALFLTLFLPVVLGLYALMNERYRVMWLVLASLFFYAWGEPKAVLCMIAMIAFNFAVAPLLSPGTVEATEPQTATAGGGGFDLKRFFANLRCFLLLHRRALFALAVIANLGTLFVYKYLDFAVLNVNSLLGTSFKLPGIALPIGISFYCFQCVSYLADAYRGTIVPSRRPDLFALYIAFFPALIAGPVVRYIDVEADLTNRRLDLTNMAEGLQRFVMGLTKKVLLADPLGLMADKVMSLPPSEIHAVWAWIGIVSYALQIFYDFSSYSDMAIGLARFFNLKLPENFRLPYSATGMQDFWRRWHISLSTWLRDYVYIPLGGSRCGTARTYRNVWTVFLLCGLWHGAGWPFVIWGAWHGLGLTLERLGLAKILERLPYALQNLYVWLFFLAGWVWFRSPDVSYALGYFKALVGLTDANFWMHQDALLTLSLLWLESLFAGLILSYEAPNALLSKLKNSWTGVILTLVLFLVTWAFATTSTFSPFIYFRF